MSDGLDLLERGWVEAFFHYVTQHRRIGAEALEAPGEAGVMLALAAWGRGNGALALRMLDAMAGSGWPAEAEVWGRGLRAALAESTRMRALAAARLEAVAVAEPAPPGPAALSVLTTGTRPDPLRALLRGFRAEDPGPVRVHDNGPVSAAALVGKAVLVPAPGEEYQVLKALLPPGQRLTIDHYRAVAAGRGDLLVVEDDIGFCMGWRAALARAQRAAAGCDRLAFITLFQPDAVETPWGRMPLPAVAPEPGPLAPEALVGAQAIWYPAAARPLLCAALRPLVFRDYAKQWDVLLRDGVRACGLVPWTTGVSLVEHVSGAGGVTGGFQHRAGRLLGALIP